MIEKVCESMEKFLWFTSCFIYSCFNATFWYKIVKVAKTFTKLKIFSGVFLNGKIVSFLAKIACLDGRKSL
jgi:hypothetical protein